MTVCGSEVIGYATGVTATSDPIVVVVSNPAGLTAAQVQGYFTITTDNAATQDALCAAGVTYKLYTDAAGTVPSSDSKVVLQADGSIAVDTSTVFAQKTLYIFAETIGLVRKSKTLYVTVKAFSCDIYPLTPVHPDPPGNTPYALEQGQGHIVIPKTYYEGTAWFTTTDSRCPVDTFTMTADAHSFQ